MVKNATTEIAFSVMVAAQTVGSNHFTPAKANRVSAKRNVEMV